MIDMTRVLLVVWALLSGACSLRAVNTGTLVASTAALACDWGQTRGVAAAGGAWKDGSKWEMNPIMGPTPSTGTVDLYFAAVAAANVGLWTVMPRRLRWIVPSIVLAAQIHAVSGNIDFIPTTHVGDRVSADTCGL